MGKPYPEGGVDIPLSGHVTELRKRILWIVIPMVIVLPASIWKATLLLDAFFAPMERLGCALYRCRVTDEFILTVRAAVLMVITAFMPWIAFQAARFIWPGPS